MNGYRPQGYRNRLTVPRLSSPIQTSDSNRSRQRCHGVLKLVERAGEEVISRIDKFEALRFGKGFKRRADRLFRTELIERAVQEIFIDGAVRQIIPGSEAGRKTHRDEAAGLWRGQCAPQF